MNVAGMFDEASLPPALAHYLSVAEAKLGEAADTPQLDRQGKSDFEAAIRALVQAADSEPERDTHLREAKARFTQAIDQESGVRIFHAHLGLAMTYRYLEDAQNMVEALRALVSRPTPTASAAALRAKTVTDITSKAAEIAAKRPWWAVPAAIIAVPAVVLLPAVLVAGGGTAAVVAAARTGKPAYDRWLVESQHIDGLKADVKKYLVDSLGDFPAA